MPFLPNELRPVYYRRCDTPGARANVLLLHGVGEHSGLYLRFAYALNAKGYRVWMIDHCGHGHTYGTLEDAYDIATLADNAQRLTEVIRAEDEGLPLAVVGHSMGGVTAALLASRPDAPRLAAMVLTGTPLGPIAFPPDIAGTVMSEDAQYLDDLAVDPLLPKEEILFPRLAAGFDAAHAQIDPAGWKFPILLVSGDRDPVAPPEQVRRWARGLAEAQIIQVENGHHDILNDWCHLPVTEAILSFLQIHTAAEFRKRLR